MFRECNFLDAKLILEDLERKARIYDDDEDEEQIPVTEVVIGIAENDSDWSPRIQGVSNHRSAVVSGLVD